MEELLVTKTVINLLRGKASASILGLLIFIVATIILVAITVLCWSIIGIIWNILRIALKAKQIFFG